MRIKFSEDYKGPGFGLLTKAKEFDKWAHFSGSAAGVLLLMGLGIPAWIAAGVIALVGLGLEIVQGIDGSVGKLPDRADGFSFLDLGANLLGILLAAGVVS